jgi:ubiquinone/menaquinone biosynthesis C-methylase UbiE
MIKDRITSFFWRQYGKPSGFFGRFIGNGMARSNEYDARWTVSLLNIKPESRVLEIGFGPGVSTQYAAEKASKGFVVGIDHSQGMVQAARKRNAPAIKAGRMELKKGDVSSLPYPSGSFDIAFSLHSIYFWENPVECIRELQRVLKHEGLLAITIQPKDKWNAEQQQDSDMRQLFFGTDLASMYAQAGLRDARVEVSPRQDKSLECVLGVR